MKLTTIDLPHACVEVVGGILKEAGFTIGTVGSGMVQLEREGAISGAETNRLVKLMGEAMFEFDTDEFDDDDM